MILRSLSLVACLCFVGCAAPSAGEETEVASSSESGLTSLSSMLRAQTALDRARTLDLEAGSVAVDYAPSPYEPVEGRRLAFEAVTFEASAASEPTDIAVAGDFPSDATVIITNDRFEPLAVSRTRRSTTSGLAEAALRVPAGEGQRFVLVRDPKWVKPMTFEVAIRPGAQR